MRKLILILALATGILGANAQCQKDASCNKGSECKKGMTCKKSDDCKKDCQKGMDCKKDCQKGMECKKDCQKGMDCKKDMGCAARCTPILHGIQLSGKVGSNRNAPKEIGIEGVWKQRIAKDWYFNGGLSFDFNLSGKKAHGAKRDLFEVGLPLQIEFSRFCHRKAGLYGIVGLQPTVYTSISATRWDAAADKNVNDIKKTGFLIAPEVEFGGNIPVGNIFMRIGVYGTYRVNCTTSEVNISNTNGKFFAGAKIGVIL